MKLAICSDEISQDFLTAVELGAEWGVRWYELRRFRSGRVPEISEGDRERIRPIAQDYGVRISAISPGLFKEPVNAPEVARGMAEVLPRAFDLAHEVGTDKVVCFAFDRDARAEKMGPEEVPPEVIDRLGEMANAAQAADVHLLLETEAVCWGDTGLRTAAIIRRVGHDRLRMNWDPANSYSAGAHRPFPDEYNKIKDLVAHVHVKDVAADDPQRRRAVPVGQGAIDWPGQIRALIADGFDGFYTIETHHRPLVQASRRCVEALRRMVVEVV
jgi:sugar phosphate isomerase/epimerase